MEDLGKIDENFEREREFSLQERNFQCIPLLMDFIVGRNEYIQN